MFEQDAKITSSQISRVKRDAENHANHFAMIENFVEKYIPIRIQSQISMTLNQILPESNRDLLYNYEKDKFREMH